MMTNSPAGNGSISPQIEYNEIDIDYETSATAGATANVPEIDCGRYN